MVHPRGNSYVILPGEGNSYGASRQGEKFTFNEAVKIKLQYFVKSRKY